MSDTISPEKRSWTMSHIKGKDTSIEVRVRKYLFSQGFRYRKNVTKLPGKPDIVFPKYKVVVFIHGCFWHSHKGCKIAHIPKSRQDYWVPKLTRNVENDTKHYIALQQMGWTPIVIWECEVNKQFDDTMLRLMDLIRNSCGNVIDD